MSVKRKIKNVAALLLVGVVLGACGGAGTEALPKSTSSRVKNAALTTWNVNWMAPCNEGGVCKLGDKGPGGGIVFYVGTNPLNVVEGVSGGGIYMEFLDLSTEFGSGAGKKTKPEWGCRRTSVASTQAPTVNNVLTDSVGKGAQNTKDIVAACTTAGIPAEVALNLSRNGQSDWFLPSFGELNQVCWFLRGQVKGNTELCSPDAPVVRTDITTQPLENVRYWSSTEGNGEYASTYSFNATSKDGKLTLFTGGVRKDVTYPDIGVVRSFGQLPPTCKDGGPCKVGDAGPGGGVVFYVADKIINKYGNQYPGGKYLEFVDAKPTLKVFAPAPCSRSGSQLQTGYSDGAMNTVIYSAACEHSAHPLTIARQLKFNGKTDWFVPTTGEMHRLTLFSRGQATDGSETLDKTRQSILGPRFTETFWTSSPFGNFFIPYSMAPGKSAALTRATRVGILFVRAFGG